MRQWHTATVLDLIHPSIAALSASSLKKDILRTLRNQLHGMTVERLAQETRAAPHLVTWTKRHKGTTLSNRNGKKATKDTMRQQSAKKSPLENFCHPRG